MNTRFALFIVLTSAIMVRADDPPGKLSEPQKTELIAKLKGLKKQADEEFRDGEYAKSEKTLRAILSGLNQLYPKEDFPKGHTQIASNLVNLGVVVNLQGKSVAAEKLVRDGMMMRNNLIAGDHAAKATDLGNLALVLQAQGRYTAAAKHFEDAWEMQRRVYDGDHPTIATTIHNLASVLEEQNRFVDAEQLYREALAMERRLHKEDDASTATSLNNLAIVLRKQGKYSDAEQYLTEALALRKRLLREKHPAIATCQANLALLMKHQGRFAEAEPLARAALENWQQNYKGDHPAIASGLSNLASLLHYRGRYEEAERLCRQSLEMRQRMLRPNHPMIASSLNDLSIMLQTQGRYAEAEPLVVRALEIDREESGPNHPNVASSLSTLGGLYHAWGRLEKAQEFLKESVRITRMDFEEFAGAVSEGDALNRLATLPQTRDGYLSLQRSLKGNSIEAYETLWMTKGALSRVAEQRQLAARTASDPELARKAAELASARHARAEILLAPRTKDPDSLQQRKRILAELDQSIDNLTRSLARSVPTLARTLKLRAATVASLRAALPEDAAFVDFFHYQQFDYDNSRPAGQREKRTLSYAAFVIGRHNVALVDLGAASEIDRAVDQWREAILTPPHVVPQNFAGRVRELIWDLVRKELPTRTKTVYVSPDAALTRVPWAAIPGDKPNSILLEEYAIAMVPHGLFLLDQLSNPEADHKDVQRLLAVGGVSYGAQPEWSGIWSEFTLALWQRRRDPVPSGITKRIFWPPLPGAETEVKRVAKLAADRAITTQLLTGSEADTQRVLREVPRAQFVHIATHGFFAEPTFRSVLQLDPDQFVVQKLGRERRGSALRSPMVLSGLVFAGANQPDTPGRGILTGESFMDRDLSSLKLAVLSACDSGLGETAGGEGVFGLQRAFHLAGCRNVVATLWKVDDLSTAALMGEFYRNLWEEKLPVAIALQQAQLAVYRANPKQLTALANRGPVVGDKNFDAAKLGVQLAPNGQNPPILWAAFTVSGIGR